MPAPYKIEKSRDMPNVSGSADIFGREVDEGFEEIRYVGLKDKSTAKFVIRQVDIISNETTMSGGKFSQSYASGNVNTYGNNANINVNTTGFEIDKGAASMQALPGFSTEFEHNFKQNPTLERSSVSIEIIDANPSAIKYKLIKK